MNAKLIGCPSTKKEIEYLGSSLCLDCEFLDFNLHAEPNKLRDELQKKIHENQHYDLIILTYSRCSDMIVGLASPTAPLLLPGTHDCISLLLGSDERRYKLSDRNPGSYYFSPGWLDYGRNPYEEYQEYVDRFGEKDANYLIQTLYGQYNEAVFIDTCDFTNKDTYLNKVKEIASFFGWRVSEVKGDLGLLKSLINGLITPAVIYVPPGKIVTLADIPGRSPCKSG